MTVPSSPTKPAVILVADRTLSARYTILFEGMFATMQTRQVPEWLMKNLLSPTIKTDSTGRAPIAPLGLRRIESSLLASGALSEKDILTTTPEALPSLLGPWVKLILFSSSDPLGRGMSNTTTQHFWKGDLYTRFWTRQLLESIRPFKDKYHFRVIAGGAGAWQWQHHHELAEQLGIDSIFQGYFEPQGPERIRNILQNKNIPSHFEEPNTGVQHIQPIRNASLMGMIELSRGCGKGCVFCTMARKPMHHLPEETILADLETNLSQGITTVASSSEDFFRYGAQGNRPDFDKLHHLLTRIRQFEKLSFMQIDHANISTVLQYTDQQLKEIRRLLTWRIPCRYLWVNMGIESANGQLVKANCPGKLAGENPQDWPDRVRQAADKMNRTGFFPVFSVILGLPGETGSDIDQTIQLVKHISRHPCAIFPIFYEPTLAEQLQKGYRFDIDKMRTNHLDLVTLCYEQNFKWVPKMYRDNQAAGGVPWTKRSLIQCLGKLEVLSWRKNFKKQYRQLNEKKSSD